MYIYKYIHTHKHISTPRRLPEDANEGEFDHATHSACITDTYTHMYVCSYIYTHKHTHTIHLDTYTYENLAVCWKDANERKFDYATHKRVHHRHIRVSLEIMKQMLRHFSARTPQRTIHLHIYTPSVQPERDHLLLIKIRKPQFATKCTISNDCRAIFLRFSSTRVRTLSSDINSQKSELYWFHMVYLVASWYWEYLAPQSELSIKCVDPCRCARCMKVEILKSQFATKLAISNDYKADFWECLHPQFEGKQKSSKSIRS